MSHPLNEVKTEIESILPLTVSPDAKVDPDPYLKEIKFRINKALEKVDGLIQRYHWEGE